MEILSEIRKALEQTIKKSSTNVPDDVLKELRRTKIKEDQNPILSSQLELMIKNIEYGSKREIPICQDTGLVNIFIQLGSKFPIISNFKGIIEEILKKLTKESRLRANTVDPITQINEGNNLGENTPPIYLDIIENSNEVVFSVLNKGGGSENISSLFMLSAATGYEEFIKKIVETMKNAGGKPCPPTILGIGLGGDSSKSMYLAKKALLRPLGSRNARKEISELENRILNEVNELEIGIMGLGGHSNCLDVRMEWSMRHPASYPVGLCVQCYSHRTYSCKIDEFGTIEYGRLNEKFQFEKEEI